jgi:hypothetical protein
MMMQAIVARMLFESSPFDAFWSAWSVGYCVVGIDGRVYLTAQGEAYLQAISADRGTQ